METSMVSGFPAGGSEDLPITTGTFDWRNPYQVRLAIVISGGIVSLIAVSLDGVTFHSVGALSGQFHISAGHWIRIVNTLLPTKAIAYPQ